MDNPGYVTLSRQEGLLKDLRVIANNIANLSTGGFRRESVVFTEMVDKLDVDGGSISQTAAQIRVTDFSQGPLQKSGGSFDFGIEGDGFFQIETPDGIALTRAGTFNRNAAGELVANDGSRVLGEGGAPLLFPPGARNVAVATDGTISADGQAVGRIALVTVDDRTALTRGANNRFTTEEPLNEVENGTIFQGFVEQSNVDPVRELTRMIEVQRAYEAGQSFLQTEDERMRQSIRVLGTTS